MSLQRFIMQSIGALDNNQENIDLSGTFQSFLNNQGINIDELYKPPIDIIEDDNIITIYMDIPGVNTQSLDIDFYNNKIEISGTREQPYISPSKKREIVYGHFSRKITIPISVTNKDSVIVSSKNGVLKLTIDKINEERNKFKVQVVHEE